MPHIKTHIYIDTHFRIYFYGINFYFGMIFIVQKNPKKVYILVDFCLFLWSVIINLLHICVHFICIFLYTLSLA